MAAFLVLATPVAAQEDAEITTPASLHKEPEGVPLVTLPAGSEVETGRAKGAWNEATVEGWIYTNSTERTRREGFDLVVTPDAGENLRRSPNGPVVGRVREGTLLERVDQQGHWTRVRRDGWIPAKAIAGNPDPSKPGAAAMSAKTGEAAPGSSQGIQTQQPAARSRGAQAPVAGATAASDRPDASERVQTARETPLAAAPEGGTLGTIQQGAPARVIARAGELVKVQVEGWVPADALAPTDGGAMVGVTAAEVRSTPERFVGRTVDWRVQVIAVKTADELRSEMAPGQPYLLTRGPLPEPGFVYVSIPPARVAEFQALPPLQELVVRASIRAARTKFLTTPVVELVSVLSGMEGK
ncbi:MAG TPA: hypothetical protein VMY76_05075 [Gemmatimonadales bacterium]|nr:hypothetical protein [Gemmatimonadales bacterium]